MLVLQDHQPHPLCRMPHETQIDGDEIIDHVNFDGFKWVGVGDMLHTN